MAVTMEVAMEVAWRGSELGTSPVLDVKKKRAWGADAQQLMQLMMGQLHSQPAEKSASELTLDLFVKSTDPSSSVSQLSSPEFLQLDPEEPLPSGWEKCLDLQTGKLYYVNKSSGVSSSDDPRRRSVAEAEMEFQTMPHEFLGSKRSETLRQESLKASSSSSSGSPRSQTRRHFSQHLPFSAGKQLRNLQLDDRYVSIMNRNCSSAGVIVEGEEDSNLELDLNLAAGGASPSWRQEQTVCTMEMIQNALKRTSENAPRAKRELPRARHRQYSVSSSFSSLTNSTRSEPSGASPSTSSSSSASSRSSLRVAREAPGDESRQSFKSSSTGVCEAESMKVEKRPDPGALVMGACTHCLMYVMLNKTDPRCPRCESEVPVDFGAPPSKRQRAGLNFGSDRK